MPRKLRIQYPGAMYHVMNRGDRRENIFWDKPDREVFISTLGEACRQTEWQVHTDAEGMPRQGIYLRAHG
jgi:putative transposase